MRSSCFAFVVLTEQVALGAGAEEHAPAISSSSPLAASSP